MILEAWIYHHHVILRPDDIWFTILVQLNFYMTKRIGDLNVHNLFVDFKGKENITVGASTARDGSKQFPGEIQKRVKTKWLREWIFPNFTTTVAETDHMVSGILMMVLVKSYLEFSIAVPCGILHSHYSENEKVKDNFHAKLERLPKFGAEPAEYGTQLQPILKRFVKTFDNPQDLEIRRFWANAVRAGFDRYTRAGPVEGWLNGLQFWNMRGARALNAFGHDLATLFWRSTALTVA